jgi:hypothetical protein
MDEHRAGFTLNFDALTGQLVQRLSVALQRRIHGWNLGNRPEKSRQCGSDRSCQIRRHRALLHHLAFQVTGRAACAESRGEFVFLVAFEQVARNLGGFAEANGQHAGGQRIETAGVTGLDAPVGATHALYRSA